MATTDVPLKVELDSRRISVFRSLGERLHRQELDISFQRTVRVADNHETNNLPPGLGRFPIYEVKDYSEKLPPSMIAKVGFLLPMYQREAMWIRFKSHSPFAIKLYIGGVNAVSSEPAREIGRSMMRRFNLLEKRKSIQD